MIITLGGSVSHLKKIIKFLISCLDQRQQTSISELKEGQWNETYEFTVSFHAQLFGTIQMDLYDSYTIYPDKHVGRAEIRLKTLELMPESFTSYYEIWDKKLSTGASSSIVREKARVNNVGALHVTITYRYLRTSSIVDLGQNLGTIKEMRTAPMGSTDLMTEEQLAAEFRRHLQFHRERKKTNKGAFKFRKYEESQESLNRPDDSDYSLEDEEESDSDDAENLTGSLIQPSKLSKQRTDSVSNHQPINGGEDEEFGELVGAFGPDAEGYSIQVGYTEQSHITTKSRSIPNRNLSTSSNKPKTKLIEERDENNSGNSKGLWAATETSQVIRTIGKLLATFGQGFELTNMQVLTGFTALEKFYSDLPRNRTWDIVEDLSEIDMGARFWKFSIASYGWKGLNFIGKGNGIISDAMREHSDAKSIIEYLTIPKEDLLAYEFRSAEAFRPSYFIARDRFTNSIVLSIRGTMVRIPY